MNLDNDQALDIANSMIFKLGSNCDFHVYARVSPIRQVGGMNVLLPLFYIMSSLFDVN